MKKYPIQKEADDKATYPTMVYLTGRVGKLFEEVIEKAKLEAGPFKRDALTEAILKAAEDLLGKSAS